MSTAFRQTVRGMRDFLPKEAEMLKFVEQTAREVGKLYGFQEVLTPVVEPYELLAAKIGEDNRKRMFAFNDLGGRKVALRPEFTASIARLVASKMQSIPKPLRLFSAGSLYRYDEPQFGRYREFWQVNFELFGSNRPEADVEILSLTNTFLKRTGIQDYHLKINNIGILRGILNKEGIAEEQQNIIMQLFDKKQWDDALKLTRSAKGSKRCLDVLKKLLEIKGKDPGKVIMEIEEVVKEYPEAIQATKNLNEILTLLKSSDEQINIFLEAGFARGLEYYTGIILEIYVPEMDIALGGGGRYDKLIELFGGGSIPAVGVAPGIDRITLALEKQGAALPVFKGLKMLIIPVDSEMMGETFRIASILRKEGFLVEIEVMGRSVSQALSEADRKGITHTVIVGALEMKESQVVLRNMKERSQEIVSLKALPERLRS